MTGIGIVGCGFVADLYMQSLRQHPDLALVGVFDIDEARASRFCAYYAVQRFDSLDQLLRDGRVRVVLNLTNPRAHFEISRRCLEAGRHVYSEKPLAMDFSEAKELVALAQNRSLWISSAPCSLLGETAQTMWRALRARAVGAVRVVYAELDDGLVHRMPYRNWLSESGAPWPYRDEFEVGCTLEHAGYYLTWLIAFFGPVQSMTAWASVQVPDKLPGEQLQVASPDFSVACLQFKSGVTARLTCSIVAPHDHELRIVGDDGVLATRDCWMYRSPVTVRRMMRIRRRQFFLPWTKRFPLAGAGNPKPLARGAAQMDWCRGVSDLAQAIQEGRKPRLAPDFCLHVTELSLGIHNAARSPGNIPISTTFEPVEPMPWAL
ncbi:MAG: Gfo/Idh/MocA family oxidoreductase [Betaproteobacteria bacterium]